MNFHYSTYTTHRPINHSSSHFNEDAHCDNEVNLILEKNYNQQLIEQSIVKEQQQQQSVVVNQTDQYYFMPIREQSLIMALPSANNSNAPDSSSSLLADLQNPSRENLFDYSISTTNSSTVNNKSNDSYNLTDADLAALFVSSIVSTTPSTINSTSENTLEHANTLDDVFIQQMNDLVCSNQSEAFGPPPGFENFRLNSSENSTINTAAALQSQVSSSDTINFSQLLPSTIVGKASSPFSPQANLAFALDSQPSQQTIGGNLRSSSSSHSSFTSDEQSLFFPLPTHHYSASQIASTTNAKQFLPASLSNAKTLFSSVETNPSSTERQDGDMTPSHLFASPNSFFSNGHKGATKPSTTNRQSSSSTSSSTSSSIDDALIQLSQQQQKQQTGKKLFSNEALSMFNFPSKSTRTNIDREQQAVHENINFLASMAAASSTPVTPDSPWQQQQPTKLPSNPTLQRPSGPMGHAKQSPSLKLPSTVNMPELIENLNEICYRGFDELNALIQEQRWVQNYLNVNPSSPNSPLVNIYGTNACSARVLIVPEYLIFKCKKVEITASHVYELLATGRPELRLKDLMFVFKSWKEAITNAELIHQEEEMKLRLTTEHAQTYYMNDTVLQAAFERISHAIRQLGNITQQARAAFQYATLNVFQMSSRQQQQQQSLSTSTSNLSQSANALALAQLQAMQQQKSSSSIHRIGGSIHTTP